VDSGLTVCETLGAKCMALLESTVRQVSRADLAFHSSSAVNHPPAIVIDGEYKDI
jgi:hypothetical protein